jgi:hypothetical protein
MFWMKQRCHLIISKRWDRHALCWVEWFSCIILLFQKLVIVFDHMMCEKLLNEWLVWNVVFSKLILKNSVCENLKHLFQTVLFCSSISEVSGLFSVGLLLRDPWVFWITSCVLMVGFEFKYEKNSEVQLRYDTLLSLEWMNSSDNSLMCIDCVLDMVTSSKRKINTGRIFNLFQMYKTKHNRNFTKLFQILPSNVYQILHLRLLWWYTCLGLHPQETQVDVYTNDK